MTAGTFRKKPVEVQAMQWTGGLASSDELVQWTRGNFTWYDDTGEVWDYLHETWVELEVGDWIIRGIQGEFYPCKQDIFAETYERVAK